MTAACLVLASVVYAPLAALNWPSAVPPAKVLLALAGLAVVCTAGAFLIFFRLIAEVGPARASVITYINPAIAVSLGVLVLGEHVTPVDAGRVRDDPGRVGAGDQARAPSGAGGAGSGAGPSRGRPSWPGHRSGGESQ